MSGLKVYSQCYDGTDGLFYLKSEVDKVIADLEEQSHQHYERWFNLNKQYEGWLGKVQRCESAESQLRYNKYKRCLAMAKLCEERDERLNQTFRHGMPDWIAEKQFIKNWHKRWLELAEKFKEGK